ncbi:MAG: hypothetical protein LBD48_13990 [Treponema sp.]|jgi:hypothetical protein|nr:hypothetical protein [Treponema sp.]
MNLFNRKMLKGILITAALVTALFASCDMGTDPEDETGFNYPQAAAKVDYNGAKKAVFIDFSTDTVVRELLLDFFYIAINGSGAIIANSGSYGSGAMVYKTDKTDITDDCTSLEANVKEFTFAEGTSLYGYQAEVTPFKGEIKTGMGQTGDGSGKVYLVKTEANNFYKVIFDKIGMLSMGPSPTPGYKITVVKGLAGSASDKTELTDSLSGITNGFGYIYFDLDANPPRALNTGTALADGVTLNIPKAADWDILCARTNELQSLDGSTLAAEMPVAGRSSILLNTYKGVEVYTAAGKSIDQVLNLDGLSSDDAIDAIGYSWYHSDMSTKPPTNTAKKNTYVVKTVEGNYVKFQPGSFYGPSSESFYMGFRYYSGDAEGNFDK